LCCRPSHALFKKFYGRFLVPFFIVVAYYETLIFRISDIQSFRTYEASCGLLRVALSLLAIMYMVQCPFACSEVMETLYKTVTLRVSPHGWSIQFWPEHIQRTSWRECCCGESPKASPQLLDYMAQRCEFCDSVAKLLSSSVSVQRPKSCRNVRRADFFLQAGALLYPPCRRKCSASAELHTAKGAVSLHDLLGYRVWAFVRDTVNSENLSFMQQDLETLVATINRHLSHVNQAPVSLQNDSHPSVLTTTVRRRKFAMKAADQDSLLREQQHEVRAVNFPLRGRWVSTDKVDASTARLSTVSLSPMHASAASKTPDSRDVSVPTMRARFLCCHVPFAASYFCCVPQ
jgi:hypothetical protein